MEGTTDFVQITSAVCEACGESPHYLYTSASDGGDGFVAGSEFITVGSVVLAGSWEPLARHMPRCGGSLKFELSVAPPPGPDQMRSYVDGAEGQTVTFAGHDIVQKIAEEHGLTGSELEIELRRRFRT